MDIREELGRIWERMKSERVPCTLEDVFVNILGETSNPPTPFSPPPPPAFPAGPAALPHPAAGRVEDLLPTPS